MPASPDSSSFEFALTSCNPNIKIAEVNASDALRSQFLDEQQAGKIEVSGKRELQPNGCYSSPKYESIIDVVVAKIYDPQVLAGIPNLRHMYDCRIKTDADAVKYASQALKFDDDPYTGVLLNSRVFPDHSVTIGAVVRPESPKRGTDGRALPQWMTVEKIEKGSASERGGLRAGDQIRAIDGVSMAGKSWSEVLEIIDGPADTTVALRVMRSGAPRTVEITRAASKERADTSAVVRETLKDAPLVSDRDLGGGIAYLKLADFNHEGGTKILADTMKKYNKSSAFVLDLRDNPGGLLTETIDSASLFLWQGDLLTINERVDSPLNAPTYLSTKYSVTGNDLVQTLSAAKNGSQVEISPRTFPYMLNGRPLVVLTNEESASAAEAFTGALHDNRVAKVMGQKTSGKGIGQEYFEQDDFDLRVTSFRYYTPRGTWAGDAHKNRPGLLPDIIVEEYSSKGDTQLSAAIAHLKARLAVK